MKYPSQRVAILFAMTFLLGTLNSSEGRAQTLQAEIDIRPDSGLWYAPTALVGVLFRDRFAVESGFGFATRLGDAEDGTLNVNSYSVPLELVVYLGDSKSSKLIPSLRAGASYTRSKLESRFADGNGVMSREQTAEDLTGRMLFGLNYFVSEHFGVSGQYGVRYTNRFSSQPSQFGLAGADGQSISSEVRLGFTMRM